MIEEDGGTPIKSFCTQQLIHIFAKDMQYEWSKIQGERHRPLPAKQINLFTGAMCATRISMLLLAIARGDSAPLYLEAVQIIQAYLSEHGHEEVNRMLGECMPLTDSSDSEEVPFMSLTQWLTIRIVLDGRTIADVADEWSEEFSRSLELMSEDERKRLWAELNVLAVELSSEVNWANLKSSWDELTPDQQTEVQEMKRAISEASVARHSSSGSGCTSAVMVVAIVTIIVLSVL